MRIPRNEARSGAMPSVVPVLLMEYLVREQCWGGVDLLSRCAGMILVLVCGMIHSMIYTLVLWKRQQLALRQLWFSLTEEADGVSCGFSEQSERDPDSSMHGTLRMGDVLA